MKWLLLFIGLCDEIMYDIEQSYGVWPAIPTASGRYYRWPVALRDAVWYSLNWLLLALNKVPAVALHRRLSWLNYDSLYRTLASITASGQDSQD